MELLVKKAIQIEIRLLKRRIAKLRDKLKSLRKRTPKGISIQTLKFVAGYEGFFATPYNDPAGFATIGFGHLLGLRPVTKADRQEWGRITRTQGYQILRKDLAGADAAVRRLVKVPLTANQLSALTSFVFNVGVGAFTDSTLLRYLNSGEPSAKVANEFGRWVYAGGKKLPGLIRRRADEAALFLKK